MNRSGRNRPRAGRGEMIAINNWASRFLADERARNRKILLAKA